MTALDVFPAEVWLRVIRLACADTSFTSRTLSLVSREIYELSKPYRTQSVSLLGIQTIFRFYRTLTSSAQDIRVVHLLIGCLNLRFEHERLKRSAHDNKEVLAIAEDLSSSDTDTLTTITDINSKVLGQCVQRILSLVAGTLKSLHLHFVGFNNIYLLPNDLPALEHLVLYGTHTFEKNPLYHFPRLAAVRVIYHTCNPSQTIRTLGKLSPSLTHFTLVQSTVSPYFLDLLDALKKLDTLWPERRARAQGAVLPKQLALEVDATEMWVEGPNNWYQQLLEVAATTHRIKIIRTKLGWIDLEDAQNKWVAETRKWVEADWVADS